MADGVFVLITTLVGIICFLIDVVLNSGNDRHDPTTLSSTVDLTYMPMTYVRGTILQVPQFGISQHILLSFTNLPSVCELFEQSAATLTVII